MPLLDVSPYEIIATVVNVSMLSYITMKRTKNTLGERWPAKQTSQVHALPLVFIINPTIIPYKPKTSAKINIRTIPTNNLGSCIS